MAGLLHDLYAYKSGSYDDHAHKGEDYAREVLDDLRITDANRCAAVSSRSSLSASLWGVFLFHKIEIVVSYC